MSQIKSRKEKWGINCKNKNATIKINLMNERARQKNSAPIAKRISGDGAFLSIQSIYFCVEFILRGVPLLAGERVPEKARAKRAIF